MHFDTSSTGDEVEQHTIYAGDLSVTILSWGGIVQDLRLAGVDYSLTLGSENIADYEGAMCHHGALIGPIANRISTARIKLDGMMHELERNQDNRIHLHSGKQAIHLRNWVFTDVGDAHVTLQCVLGDGACGLPGNRTITVTYRITAPTTLTLEITGTSDETTAMSCANHSFWNLDGSPTWDGHHLRVAADHFLPIDDDHAPTGDVQDVTGTAMDLRAGRPLHVTQDRFDHNLCLSDTPQPLRDVLTLTGQSGLCMTMATTAPGMQIYDNSAAVRPGKQPFEGLAFEAQSWPDAPNNPSFPSIILRKDATYTQTTTWSFSR